MKYLLGAIYLWNPFIYSISVIWTDIGYIIIRIYTQKTQDICITFVQCWTNVEDVRPALYKCCNILFVITMLHRPDSGYIKKKQLRTIWKNNKACFYI